MIIAVIIHFSTLMTNRFSHHYHLGKSTFILGVLEVIYKKKKSPFFIENSL